MRIRRSRRPPAESHARSRGVRVLPTVAGRMVGGPSGPRRIRLVAYGARLESVLGESPRGFESPILRTWDPSVFKGSRPVRNFVAQFVAQLSFTFCSREARNHADFGVGDAPVAQCL